MKKAVILVFAAVFLFAAAASAAEINVSAAASLREAVNALTDNFAKRNPGIEFRSNFGASGALAKQIENGAPGDVFFSANVEWMDYLEREEADRRKSVFTFAYNVLVFVGKPGVKVDKLQDVVRLNKIAIGSPKSVPAGQYAMEAFKNAGIDKQVENKLVMCRDVRECLLYADTGRGRRRLRLQNRCREWPGRRQDPLHGAAGIYPRVTYPAGLTVRAARRRRPRPFSNFSSPPRQKRFFRDTVSW